MPKWEPSHCHTQPYCPKRFTGYDACVCMCSCFVFCLSSSWLGCICLLRRVLSPIMSIEHTVLRVCVHSDSSASVSTGLLRHTSSLLQWGTSQHTITNLRLLNKRPAKLVQQALLSKCNGSAPLVRESVETTNEVNHNPNATVDPTRWPLVSCLDAAGLFQRSSCEAAAVAHAHTVATHTLFNNTHSTAHPTHSHLLCLVWVRW